MSLGTEDPELVAQAAVRRIAELEAQLEHWRMVRNIALMELHGEGVSLRALGQRYGLSKSTLHQLMA